MVKKIQVVNNFVCYTFPGTTIVMRIINTKVINYNQWQADFFVGNPLRLNKTFCLSGFLNLRLKRIISGIYQRIFATRLHWHKLFNGNEITSIYQQPDRQIHTVPAPKKGKKLFAPFRGNIKTFYFFI
jgi:hypothetical protein